MITPTKYSELRGDGEGPIEKKIDGFIKEHAHDHDQGPITIAASLLKGAVNDIERVLAKYRAAGWKAEYVYDNRDGDFIKLEQP